MSIFSSDDSSAQSTFSPSSSSFSSDLSSGSGGNVDRELQDFLIMEKQKAELSAQVHEFNDLCWEKCLKDKPGSKMDSKTETCLNNCVDRFIDVSLFITNRFAMSVQKSAKMFN